MKENIRVATEHVDSSINCICIDVYVIPESDDGNEDDATAFSIGRICLDTGKVIMFPGKVHYFQEKEVREAVEKQLDILAEKGIAWKKRLF